MHDLLKVLKEFNINISNITKIDKQTYKNYEEILYQYLNDADPEFSINKINPDNSYMLLANFIDDNGMYVTDYFNDTFKYRIYTRYDRCSKIYVTNVFIFYSNRPNVCFVGLNLSHS